MPLIVCHGCGKSVKPRGLYSHLRESGNLLCQPYLDELTFGDPIPNTLRTDHHPAPSTSGIATLSAPSTPLNDPSDLFEANSAFSVVQNHMEINTAGDFFGNYDTPQQLCLRGVVEDPEDDEDALLESLLAKEENGLEPRRVNSDGSHDNDESRDKSPVDTDLAVNMARP